MARLFAGALGSAALAAALLGGGTVARASTPAGEAAAAAMRVRTGPAPGATPDREAVLGAWEAAGARLDGVRRHLAANAGRGALDGAALLFADLCGDDLALPRDVPAPGDLLLYREPATAGARWRVAMLTGAVTAVVLDPRSRRLEEVARGRLLDDLPAGPEPRLVSQGTLRACRFSTALLPAGGAASSPSARGHRRIALVDAPETVRALQWELDHPRDADTSAGHRLTRLVVAPLALAAGAASLLLGGAGRLTGWLLDAIGPPAAPLTALWHLLGCSFDGRGLHAVLTETVMTHMLGPVVLLVGRVPLLDGVVRPLHATASFAVGVVTGVDDSRHVMVGGVLLALVCDLLVLGKPLALAGRLGLGAAGLGSAGPAATVLRRTLDLSSRAGDLLSGRPSSVLRLGGTAPRHRIHDLLDAASLLVRPASLPGHIAELSGRLAHWGRTVAATAATAPPGERALAAALRHLGAEELRHVEQMAELSHLHSGGRTLSAIAAGDLQPFGAELPPPPIHLTVPDH
jgi:hypothetical protein